MVAHRCWVGPDSQPAYEVTSGARPSGALEVWNMPEAIGLKIRPSAKGKSSCMLSSSVCICIVPLTELACLICGVERKYGQTPSTSGELPLVYITLSSRGICADVGGCLLTQEHG